MSFAPDAIELSGDGRSLTYSYFDPDDGTQLYTVDLATAAVSEEKLPPTQEQVINWFLDMDMTMETQLEAPACSVVLMWADALGRPNNGIKSYFLYLFYRDPASAPGTMYSRLLLPSTVVSEYLTDYAPTDRGPDSLSLSEDGSTLTYSYRFDDTLTNSYDGRILHEAGTYTYTVDLTTGELSVAHSEDPLADGLALSLRKMGLFLGDEKGNFNLDRVPSRTEALVMLIRALGEDAPAKAAGKTHPFSDIPSWADGYVSWGYEKGYTTGVSDTLFGGEDPADARMYLTFMLRALGYSDGEGGDFRWDSPYLAAREAGILPFEVNCLNFTRADAVLVTSAALFAPEKNFQFQALHERLEAAGAFPPEQFQSAFPTDPFAWETSVERKVDEAIDKALGVGQTNRRTALVQSHAILDVAQDGVLLTIQVLVCNHSLTDEDLNRGEFGDYYFDLYVVELQKPQNSPGTVLRCEKDEETVSYWDDPQVALFRDDLELLAQEKMTSLIGSGTVLFRPATYDEALAELRSSFGYYNERLFETDVCTVVVNDYGGMMHAQKGCITLIYKPGSSLGDGVKKGLPSPGNSYSPLLSRNPDHMELSGDKKTFTYSYHFDEPLISSGLMIRAAGDFTYTVDLATGEVTEQLPEVPKEVNTYEASLERVLAGYAEEGYVVEKTIEAPLCTLLFHYFPAENGTRSYFLELVYKTDVDVEVSGDVRHTPEGSVKTVGLPITGTDGSGQAGYPVYYTGRMPDAMSLSEDGNTFTLTYNECHYGSPYTQTIDLKTGMYDGE
jgi:hypothetical protein